MENKITLNQVYGIYQKWIYIENLRRIDIGLVIRLLSKTFGTRVWLIIVGASGDWKTEQIMALQDPEKKETKIMRQFTSKTLVNGNPRVPDLAPFLRNKLLLIPDLAPILKLHPNEKAEVWAQLRDLYDGFAGKQSGMGKDVEYKDLNVTFLAASTPTIDNQILIYQDLGTRELIWRTENCEKTKIMDMVLENEKAEEVMRLELNEITNKFLENKEYNPKIEVPEEIIKELKFQALLLTFLRATADIDCFTGELLQTVYPEQPSRILKQFKRIYIALKSLDENYPDEWALDIIKHLVYSSSNKVRYEILKLLIKENDDVLTTNNIAEMMKIGYKASFRELNTLWNLGLVIRFTVEEVRGNKLVELCKWKTNKENDIVQKLYRLFASYKIVEEEDIK
jgi:hypothetical protein